MSTHFLDYTSVEGRWTACGRFFPDDKPLGRGIAITTQVNSLIGGVSCNGCIGSDRFRLAKARVGRPLDAPARDHQ
jgi:hypothetical protein